MTMKRTTEEILQKALHFREDALMAPAAYRLYVFVPWADVPEDIKPHFPEGAEEAWEEEEISAEEMEADVKFQMINVINELIRRNTIQALFFVSSIIADLYIMGYDINQYEDKFKEISVFYNNALTTIPELADVMLTINVKPMLKEIMDLVDENPEFDVEAILEQVIEAHTVKAQNVSGLDQSIDEALKRYKEQTGEDLLEGDGDEPQQ